MFPIDTETTTGTYTFNNGAITLTFAAAFTFAGSITGSTLTVTDEQGEVLVFDG